MRSDVAWGSLLLLTAACASVPTTTIARPSIAVPAIPDARLGDAIDAYVAGFGRRWGDSFAFSGYVAVARDGQIVFGKGYGQADRNWGIVAGPDTRFRIGSTSKSFTAIGIMQLEEKGLLRLEDPVRKYLPELPPMADPVTIHHCLTHTSGLPPLPDDDALVAETGQLHPVASAFASYEDRPLMFRPGERFQYSNAGFTVLAAILERVSGQSYEAYMREHVFGPAGMARTTTVSRPSPPPETAVGYDVDPRGNVSVAKDPWYVLFGCGAILSTANDLVAFDRALSGTVLLGGASKRRMFTPEREVGGIVQTPARYGLGWLVSEEAGHQILWHPGGIHGFETSFARVPDAKLTVVVLSNRFDDLGLVGKIAEAAREAALTGKAPAPPGEPVAGPLDAATVTALAGDYGVDAPSRAVLLAKFTPDVVDRWAGLSLTAENGHLFVTVGDPGPEIFRGADGMLFAKQDDLRLTVERDGAGGRRAVTLTRAHPGGLSVRYTVLGTAIDPAPSGTCPAGMVRLPGGQQARTYPWGYRPPASQLCWSGVEKRMSTCSVASFPAGDALGGIHDLAGNVGEWTSTSSTDGYVIKAAGWNTDAPAQAEGGDARERRPELPRTFDGLSVRAVGHLARGAGLTSAAGSPGGARPCARSRRRSSEASPGGTARHPRPRRSASFTTCLKGLCSRCTHLREPSRVALG